MPARLSAATVGVRPVTAPAELALYSFDPSCADPVALGAHLASAGRAASFVRQSPDLGGLGAGAGLVVVEPVAGVPAAPPGVDFHGHFVTIGTASRTGVAADPFACAGMLVVLADNLDPARDAEFNHWYDAFHVPDVTGAAGFFAGLRLRNVEADPGPDSTGYLAIYVTDRPDAGAEFDQVQAAAPGMVRWPSIVSRLAAAYGRLRP